MSVRHHYISLAVISASFAGLLIGCASPQQAPYGAAPTSQNYERVASYSGTGVVEAIEVTHKESSGVAGAVAELVTRRMDDNLTIPLAVAAVLGLLRLGGL